MLSIRSGYINLEQLAAIVRSGEPVQVVDARTGEDLTQEVLLQVVMEALKGAELFPPEMLRLIIMATGDDPWHRALRDQLVAGMKLVGAQMSQVERLFRGPAGVGGGPWPSPPGARSPTAPEPPSPAAPDATPDPGGDPELDELRARLEALEQRLGRR